MVNSNPHVVNLSPNCQVAISFTNDCLRIDPREEDSQFVTFCLLRPIDKSPRVHFTGAGVYRSGLYDPALGKRYALVHALQAMFPDLPYQEINHLARQALFDIATQQRVDDLIAKACKAEPASIAVPAGA